jgi:hypothetical protein
MILDDFWPLRRSSALDREAKKKGVNAGESIMKNTTIRNFRGLTRECKRFWQAIRQSAGFFRALASEWTPVSGNFVTG